MPFTWTQTLDQYGIVEKQDIQEIRDNADWLDNNPAYCAANYITHLSGHYASYLSTHYISHLATHYGAYCGTNYPGHNGTHCSAVDSGVIGG